MIKIREDYKVMTHLPGKESVIPMSKAWMKAFPCAIELFTEEESVSLELSVSEVKDFTHLLEIEKGRVEVFGKAKQGYFHLFFYAEDGQIFVKLNRGKSLTFKIGDKDHVLQKGDKLALLKTETKPAILHKEKVSFGCSRKPLIENNIDLETKLFLLTQQMIEEDVVELGSETVKALLVDLFAPKKEDRDHKGLDLGSKEFDRFALFSTYRKQLRDSIFFEDGDEITFLKKGVKLPIAGRCTGLRADGFNMDLLWRKGKVQSAVIYPSKDCKKTLNFPEGPKKYRVKEALNERGDYVDGDSVLELKANQKVFIDCITY